MFKRTRSLSSAVCFKHDNNVCACTVSALKILLPVVKLSLKNWKRIQRINLLYDRQSFTVLRCLWPYYDNFSQRIRSFEHITTSGLKSDVIISPQCTSFPIKTRPLQACYPFSATFVTIMSAHAK